MPVRVASELQLAWDPSRLLSKIKKLLETQSIAKLNFAVTVVIIVTLRRKFLVIVTMLVYVCVHV